MPDLLQVVADSTGMRFSSGVGYYRQMLEYYNGAKFNHNREGPRNWTINHHKNPGRNIYLIRKIKSFFRGRHVLELACGCGYWTKYLAETAASVLATDISPVKIEIASSIVTASNVKFAVCDARFLEQLDGEFDAAYHHNFINHIPFSDWEKLLTGLHTRLEPGAIVLMSGQAFQGEYKRPGQEDRLSRRACKNGSTYTLVDNTFFDKASVADRLGPRATNVEFERRRDWWTSYVVDR